MISSKLYLGFERSNAADGVHQCQEDVDKLVHTSKSRGLLINVEKCAVLRFAHRNMLFKHQEYPHFVYIMSV